MTYSPRLHGTCIGMQATPGNPCRCCCDACNDECCPLHDPGHDNCLKPKRAWWYERDSWEWGWWQFAAFGQDEFCNRTIVLRLWNPLVVVINRTLRSESCGECLSLIFGTSESAPENQPPSAP